MHRDMGETPGW